MLFLRVDFIVISLQAACKEHTVLACFIQDDFDELRYNSRKMNDLKGFRRPVNVSTLRFDRDFVALNCFTIVWEASVFNCRFQFQQLPRFADELLLDSHVK